MADLAALSGLLCPRHGAKIVVGRSGTKAFCTAPDGACDVETLRAYAASLNGLVSEEAPPRGEPDGAADMETGSADDAKGAGAAEQASADEKHYQLLGWEAVLLARAQAECHAEVVAGRGAFLAASELKAFITLVNSHRNIPNDPITRDPAGLTAEEIQIAVAEVAAALKEQYATASAENADGAEAGAAEAPEPMGDPISLDIPVLSEFPRGIFPPWSDGYVDAVAAFTETPRELAALMELGDYAAANQQKHVVEVRKGYQEPMNIWAVAALESGNRKTTVQELVTDPVRQHEADLIAALKPLAAEATSKRETAVKRIEVLRAQAARTDDPGKFKELQDQVLEMELGLPEVPHLPQIWAQDVTPEKLSALMAENGECMAIISDEGGIFDILGGRYSNGTPNLYVFLQGHSGSKHRVDRGNRPAVMMSKPALTLVLSPQPDVLQGLASKSGFRGRGLLARFLYALPVSNLGNRTGNGPPVPDAIARDHHDHIRAMLRFQRPESGPAVIRLSAEAYREWREFSAWVEGEMRGGGKLALLRDWAGKLPGAAARIAGNLHIAEHAFGLPADIELSHGTMQRALKFAAVLVEHAVAAFDLWEPTSI
jgi:hypothetical protein